MVGGNRTAVKGTDYSYRGPCLSTLVPNTSSQLPVSPFLDVLMPSSYIFGYHEFRHSGAHVWENNAAHNKNFFFNLFCHLYFLIHSLNIWSQIPLSHFNLQRPPPHCPLVFSSQRIWPPTHPCTGNDFQHGCYSCWKWKQSSLIT